MAQLTGDPSPTSAGDARGAGHDAGGGLRDRSAHHVEYAAAVGQHVERVGHRGRVAGGRGRLRVRGHRQAARPVNPPPTTGVPTTGSVKYVLAMTAGKVTITLDRAKAPCTVNSFVSLAEQGYFDKTKCHRLADSGIFVLQCGDPTGTGSGGPGYQFANETDGTETYTRGVVAMANAGPDTNGSQFFMIWDDSTRLDQTPNYTIFGRLDTASRDVVATMAGEGQDGSNGDGTGRPNNPSEILSAKKG